MKAFFHIQISLVVKHSMIAAFAACSLYATGQGRYLQKLYAYKEMRRNTNIFITDTTHANAAGFYANYLIYVELPQSDIPIWNSAIIGNDTFSVHPTLVTESPLVIGERKRDKKLIKIRPNAGSHLWKLELDAAAQKPVLSTAATEETVLLKGTFKNRKITSTIGGIVELE